MPKENMDTDKMRAKKAAARERIEKKIKLKQQKNMQPGECLKFMKVHIDQEIKNMDFYQETLTMLDSSSVTYSVNSLLIPSSVVWTRHLEEDSIDDENKVSTVITKERQKHLLIIWSWKEVVTKIRDQSFSAHLASAASEMPQMKLSLIIYGIEGYFDYHKRRAKKTVSRLHEGIDSLPKISRDDFEDSLIDIQIALNCNSRLIENAADMSLLIYQYTKAIAEIPLKLETNQRLHDQVNFYAAGDNKNTIKVDSDGNGLKKLWLKQLCMFNNTGLATAEAICALYSSPDQLIDQYEKLSQEEGEALLKDTPIRRAAGPLTTVRKLGPELSRKMHILFTSKNGENLLN